MGNQQPKEKSLISVGISDNQVLDTDIFNSNDDIDISSDLWLPDSSVSITSVETNNLSSFTVSDPKNTFVIAQKDFISTRPHSEISVNKGERLKFKGYSPDGLWANVKKLDGKANGWVPSNIVSEMMENGDNTDSHLQQFSWYHGAVQRSFAEYLLNSGINGSFLVRESESNPRLRSLSLRYEGKIWHFRISKDASNKYYVVDSQRFSSIQKLIEYHSKYADTLPCQLLYPAPKLSKATVFGVAENDLADNWEIDRTEILMKDQLGGGQYGIVYEGFWQRHQITVAVKTVKADVTVADDFLEEARLMKSLQHPNLVRLLGVCTREPPNYIITEFMENGNLLDYLRTKPKEELSPPVLLYMAIQISAGMAYLEEHNFIHRDLAARNCLVGKDNIVKVADFGLARCMERDDTYTAHVGAKFPIKWTAPEGLAYNIFSTKSDVWAFGVLLWELATYGMTPYPGIELQDVYVYLQKDNIMSRPSGCPENVYELMKQCWQWQPENRPTFKKLHSKLETMLSNINEQVDLEMAKENNMTDLFWKNPNCPDDSLPNPPNQVQLLSHHSLNKRKEAPVPPQRTITLKDMSLTSSFTMSNQSLMEQSFSEDLLNSLSDDEFLPLPPPEDILSNNFETPHRCTSNLPPPVMKNKPKRIESPEFSSPSILKNNLSYKKGSNDKISNFDFVIAPKSTNTSSLKSSTKIPQNIASETIKRVKSERTDKIRPIEKDFQSELKSRLKLHQKGDENDKLSKEDNMFKSSAAWPARKSVGYIKNSDTVIAKAIENAPSATQTNCGNNILTPSNKRMSWTGPSSSINAQGKRPVTNMAPLSSSSNLGSDNDDNDGDDNGVVTDNDEFITKDNLLGEFNSLCQELTNLRYKKPSPSPDRVSGIVEKLETVHLGSTRYCNASISSAKIKFKFIEQCANLRKGIESLRKCLKPYDHSSTLTISNGIKTSLADLKMLIESNN